jgi:nicotinamide riboside transporter PnuC
VIVYLAMGMYPTAVLFAVYTVMAVIGLRAWGREQLRIKN